MFSDWQSLTFLWQDPMIISMKRCSWPSEECPGMSQFQSPGPLCGQVYLPFQLTILKQEWWDNSMIQQRIGKTFYSFNFQINILQFQTRFLINIKIWRCCRILCRILCLFRKDVSNLPINSLFDKYIYKFL